MCARSEEPEESEVHVGRKEPRESEACAGSEEPRESEVRAGSEELEEIEVCAGDVKSMGELPTEERAPPRVGPDGEDTSKRSSSDSSSTVGVGLCFSAARLNAPTFFKACFTISLAVTEAYKGRGRGVGQGGRDGVRAEGKGWGISQRHLHFGLSL